MTKTDPNIARLKQMDIYVGNGEFRHCPEAVYYRENAERRLNFKRAKVTVERNGNTNICITLPTGLRVHGGNTLYGQTMEILGGLKGARKLTCSKNTAKQYATEMKLQKLAETTVAQHLASNPHLVGHLIESVQMRATGIALNQMSHAVTQAKSAIYQDYRKKGKEKGYDIC